jgi:hypothetical protein
LEAAIADEVMMVEPITSRFEIRWSWLFQRLVGLRLRPPRLAPFVPMCASHPFFQMELL